MSHHPDILHHLHLLDLKHVLEIILSYLDLETLSAVEMVSPLWGWLVHSSNTIYRNKVVVSSVPSNNYFLTLQVHSILQLFDIPSRDLSRLRCPGPRTFRPSHNCDSLHSNAETPSTL